MSRKPRNDSTSQQIAAAQHSDRTAATAPRDIQGVELLGSYGLQAYDQLYRSRAEWVVADLVLISQAAKCSELIAEFQASILPGMAVLHNPKTGAVKIHPAISAITEQQRLLSNMSRDAGLRLGFVVCSCCNQA